MSRHQPARPAGPSSVSGGSTTSLGAGSFSMAMSGVLALWAKALVVSAAPAAIAASVLMSRVFALSPLAIGVPPTLLGQRGIVGAAGSDKTCPFTSSGTP
jgi:hypothetical protein